MREHTIERSGVAVALKIYDDQMDPPYLQGLVRWAGERIRVYAEAPMERGGSWLRMFLVSLSDVDQLAPLMADECIRSMRACEDARAARAA